MTDLILRQSGFDMPDLALAERPSAAAKPQRTLDFAVVATVAGLEAIAGDWNDLFDKAARPEHVFQAFGWVWHWTRHYLDPNGRRGPKLAVVTGRRDGRLVLVMPLVVERRAGLRQLSWLGEPVSQYGDVLAAPEASQVETLAEAWRFAVAQTSADLANLRRVRSDATVAPLLAHLGMAVTATEEAPYLCFQRAASAEAYHAGMPSKARQKNRRRQMRRLQERGTVTFETHSGTAEAGRLAVYAVLLKRAWLGSRDRISLALADERFARFFADVTESRVHPVRCDVLALRSANEIAAMQIVLENKGVRFLHVAVYAQKFDKTGAGSLLLENSIGDCYAGRAHCLDLLPPRHEYKMDFADGVVAVSDLALAISVLGRAYTQGYLGFRRRAKAAIEKSPAPLRRAVARAVALAKGGR